MKLLDFLRDLLPETGIYYAAKWIPDARFGDRGGYWKNLPSHSLEDLVPELNHLSRQGIDAYMALASFAEARYWDPEKKIPGRSELGGWRTRTAQNATHARAAWLDIDIGAEKAKTGEGYATRKEALTALKAVIADIDIPQPTHIVNSGGGFHIYWAFTQDIERDVWVRFANLFKSVLRAKGFRADPAVTADVARVLRPIGTLNYKRGEARPVELVFHREEKIGFKSWARAIHTAYQALPPEARKVSTSQKPKGKNAALAVEETYPPSDANQLADRCATLGAMRESLGATQPEPLWYACLGVLAFTEQGDAVCHDWSKGHEGYDESTCQEKIDHRRDSDYGPTTCEWMRGMEGNSCAKCTLAKARTSPISLGFPDSPQISTVVHEDGREEVFPTIPESMQGEFGYDKKLGLMWSIPSETEGEPPKKVRVAEQCLGIQYIYEDVRAAEYLVKVTIRGRANDWRSADIPVKAVAAGGDKLVTALGKVGVTCANIKGMQRFMRGWYEEHMSAKKPQLMRLSMGWQDDGSFALGNKLYTPDGDVLDCTLAKEIENYAHGHIPKGNLETQVDLLNKLYNRPGMEARQFVLSAALGSALVPLVHNGAVGIPIAIHEAEGGQGKTTVCKFGIGLWGDPEANGQEAHAEGITEYALYVLAGIRRHLPVLIDETTSWRDAALIAKFAYRYSSGKPKIQGAAEGGLRDNSSMSWQNFMFMTGNKSLIGLMQAVLPECGPQVARVFEVPFNHLELNSRKDSPLVESLKGHCGWIGREFIAAVVQRQDKVRKMLEKEMERLRTYVDGQTDARYWIMTAACTITAAKIAKALGLFRFDTGVLSNWIDSQVRMLRGEHTSARTEPGELLARAFSDLQSGVLLTDIIGGKGTRAVVDTTFSPPRGKEIIGRYAYKQGVLYITVRAIKKWCIENNVDYKGLKTSLAASGSLIKADSNRYLTVGTTLGTVAQHRCWEISAKGLVSVPDGVDAQEGDDASAL